MIRDPSSVFARREWRTLVAAIAVGGASGVFAALVVKLADGSRVLAYVVGGALGGSISSAVANARQSARWNRQVWSVLLGTIVGVAVAFALRFDDGDRVLGAVVSGGCGGACVGLTGVRRQGSSSDRS